MSLRTDKVSGIITWVFGLVMMGFASFGLLIIAIQRVMIGAMSPMSANPGNPGVSVIDVFNAIHEMWFIFLPLMIAGGIVFVLSGIYVQRGSTTARRLAQANAVCGYVWIVAYLISCIRVLDVVGPPPDMLSGPLSSLFQFLSIAIGTLMLAAFPTGLLYVLNQPRNGNAKRQLEPAEAV